MDQLDPRIMFLIVVPDGRPEQASPFQGFSPTLAMHSWMIRRASLLPTSVTELTPDGRETMLARRIGGAYPVHWHGQSPETLKAQIPPPFAPYIVVLLPERERAADYENWMGECPVRPVIVAKEQGDLTYAEFTLGGLQKEFLKRLDRLPSSIDPASIAAHRSAIQNWEPMARRELGYQVGGHNSVTPNLMALSVAGYQEMGAEPFKDINRGPQPYIDQVQRTANTILDLRQEIGERDVHRIFRPMPDVNLFAPSIYPEFARQFDLALMSPEEKRSFIAVRTALEGQTGYSFQTSGETAARALFGFDPAAIKKGGTPPSPSPHPLMLVRSMELTLCTDVVGSLAASEFTSVLRLPNEVNRTRGAVRSFAELYRSRAPTPRKRLLGLRQVQNRLAAAVPPGFIDVVRRSQAGVRIISDAHLEWLSVDGLPLMLQKTCSRIPTTPGNLFVQNMSAMMPLHLGLGAFSKVLVLSALEPSDPIAGMFELACEGFAKEWKGKLELETVPVASADAMVDAINGFDGALIVFDGHGSHDQGAGARLHLRGEAVDVWTLRKRIRRIAPIVLLSACDTHAADRNHETAANGFIALGARTVLSSVFPLGGVQGAIFAARMLYRVAEYLPSAVRAFDESLRWSDVVSGLLQMQAVTDLLFLLMSKNLLDRAAYREVQTAANEAINGRIEAPFQRLLDDLARRGFDRHAVANDLELAIANSDVLSYLQVGRPETILIDSRDRMMSQVEGNRRRLEAGELS